MEAMCTSLFSWCVVFHLFLFILSLIPKYFVSHALHLKAFFICEVSKYNVLEITS